MNPDPLRLIRRENSDQFSRRVAGSLRPGAQRPPGGPVTTGTVKRIAELRAGDLTSHPWGACTCRDPRAPFRVERLASRHDGTAVAVTWSHPACGEAFEPLQCVPEGFVTVFGDGQP
jgi:hypothetical protein